MVKRSRYFAAITLLFFLISPFFECQAEQLPVAVTIEAFLPPEKGDADLMELGLTRRGMELFARFQRGVSRDPEKFMTLTKEAGSGNPLPYDPLFELTRSEYEEYLSLLGKRSLRKVKTIKLDAKRSADAVVFNTSGEVPELDAITIDLAKDRVNTSYGIAAKRSVISANAKQLPSPWSGVQWRHVDEDLRSFPYQGTKILFALGKLEG